MKAFKVSLHLLDVTKDFLAVVMILVQPSHDLYWGHQVNGCKGFPQAVLKHCNRQNINMLEQGINYGHYKLCTDVIITAQNKTDYLQRNTLNHTYHCSFPLQQQIHQSLLGRKTDKLVSQSTQSALRKQFSQEPTYSVMVRMEMRDKYGGHPAEDFVHTVSIVTAQLSKRPLPTVQQHRLGGAGTRQQVNFSNISNQYPHLLSLNNTVQSSFKNNL